MRSLLSALLLTATPLWAAPPQVVSDIAPVHGLVADVMKGVATPKLIIPPTSSPHGYAMRPSQAHALQEADIVIWVGPELAPWLGDRIETLAPDAQSLALIDVPGTLHLTFREGATFEAHDHDHEGHDHDGHKEQDDHGDHESHGEHEGHADHGGHDAPHAIDPHAWLSPDNATLWLTTIAETLSKADPENAARYTANATAAQAEIETTRAEISAKLSGNTTPFLVFHDAYHYFETSFDIAAAAAVSLGDATTPGPARITEIRNMVADQGIVCAFSEPQFDMRLLKTVLEGSEARIATLDPVGRGIEPGTGFYPALLQSLGNALAGCLVQE